MQLLHRKSLLILLHNWICCGTIRAALPALKKRIVRTLIEEVVADVDSDAGEIILVIHWKGGLHTEVRVPRRRRGYNNGHTDKELVEAVSLLANICNDEFIAGVLNRNGHRTGRGNRWTKERVTALRSYHHLPRYSPDNKETSGWMNLTERSEEHTSELQSPDHLVCRLLLEK